MDLNELNKQSYDKIAAEFAGTRNCVWRDVQIFRDYLKDSDKVLDLGCGNGRLAGFLAGTEQCSVPTVADYLGVDSSGRLIEIARKNYPDKQFVVMDALNLDLPEKSFDAVVCVSVLNHFPPENHQRFIENVKKVLKLGGYLLMTNWNLWRLGNKKSVWREGNQGYKLQIITNVTNKCKWPFQKICASVPFIGWKNIITTWRSGNVQAPLYYYAFTKSELTKLLEQNGFQIVKNFYSKQGKKSSWLSGENIVTIGKLVI